MSRIPRLKKRREFLSVASTRKKWVTPGLILQVRKRSKPLVSIYKSLKPNAISEGQPDIRIGFTVSKKVGNAPERNRARRRLRAVADLVLFKKARSGFDLVLIGRKETLTRPFAQLEKDLKTALWKTGVHNEAPPPKQKTKHEKSLK
ncbi:Ribonuclease P protein component [Candidatus Terasakiella magnetica]|uniref:Ribonuclease P protein component n=1 Tax=Candidatus Terasakiella magnetica TaxID=1867952 RepID=A0A1C3RGT5_9PROT|nr:ribonuclease P protein component [Candidatus Terasakiella magnetica]SCA56517.1 Ribonuclease P protein component [Candidatus Terasakiella magnetica]